MARKAKKEANEGSPAWLITFSDMMTLLLTFFVLLLSMAVIDERHKLEVLGAVAREFGYESRFPNPTAPKAPPSIREPGRIEGADLEPLKERIFDEAEADLDFRENRYVQIFSIADEVLFTPGGTELSTKGKALLDRILPYLHQISHPLLVAGHAGSRRDEEGDTYLVTFDEATVDSTWKISLERALAIYSHLRASGIGAESLSMEAFGRFKPRFTSLTADGRRKNRRVDLVLDKRNKEWINKVEALRENAPQQTEHYYKGFRFDLSMPGTSMQQ